MGIWQKRLGKVVEINPTQVSAHLGHPVDNIFSFERLLQSVLTLTFFSSMYSAWSSLRWSTILVPRPRGSPVVSVRMVKEPPAELSQTYCSSSLCLEGMKSTY